MNLAGFAGWQTAWSERRRLAGEPLCTGFFSTLLADGTPVATSNIADFRRFEHSGLKLA